MKYNRRYLTTNSFNEDKSNIQNLNVAISQDVEASKVYLHILNQTPPYVVSDIDIQFNNDTQIYTNEEGERYLINDSDKIPTFLKIVKSQGNPTSTSGYIAQISSSDMSIQQITNNENYSVFVTGEAAMGASPSEDFSKSILMFIFGNGEKLNQVSDLGQKEFNGISSEELNSLANTFKSYKGYWGVYTSNMQRAFFFLFKDDKCIGEIDTIEHGGVPLHEYISFRLEKNSNNPEFIHGYKIDITINNVGTFTCTDVDFDENPCMYIQCYRNIGNTYMLEYLKLNRITISPLVES